MVSSKGRIGLSAVLIGAFFCATPGLAWGPEGHQIVAYIAAHELTPTARAEVQRLLVGSAERAMAKASTWADEIRPQRPETAPWHVVEIPIESNSYSVRRDCRQQNCVVAQIERDRRLVSDPRLPAPLRAEILRFLIHFVADVHQPLHAADGVDRVGNDFSVSLAGRETNMHAVWDNDIVAVLGRDAATVASALAQNIGDADRRNWESGSAATWANESFRIARQEIYSNGRGADGAPMVLPSDYPMREQNIVELQLERAGVRLGWVLNQAFP